MQSWYLCDVAVMASYDIAYILMVLANPWLLMEKIGQSVPVLLSLPTEDFLLNSSTMRIFSGAQFSSLIFFSSHGCRMDKLSKTS